LAPAMGIPAAFGVAGAMQRIEQGTTVVRDGTRGTVLLNRAAREIAEAQARERRRRELASQLEEVVEQPAVTTDGVRILLRGNVDLPDEIRAAQQHRAEGVGLLRTEFLITSHTTLPTEDEQAEYFRRVGEAFTGHPVVIRTYDLGGDKLPGPFRVQAEANPQLGWRAIRVCLDRPEIFRTQVRAALRAAAHADIQVMIPLVTRLDEVDRTRVIVGEEAANLKREGVEAASSVPVGVMVETPAAAVMADRLAAVSDFLSVGTNDLTQYTLVVDRGNARLADRFNPHDPSVLRLLKMVVDAARAAGKPASGGGKMPAQRHVFTSESVTEGHPDKIADQISDAVLDAIIATDPGARVACETLVTTGMAVVAGEITTTTYVHIPDIVRGTISAIGYTDASFGFDAQTCAILTTIDRQSGDIALGVDRGGAGDQGMMFGYASDETASLMPVPIVLARRLAGRPATVRKAGDFPWLRPDGKTQVSVIYEGSRPVGVSKLVVSTQHSDKIDNSELRAGVIALVVRPVLADTGFDVEDVDILINPTGRFVVGGPQGAAGLTGRKIIVDTYGGMARHGGGAFSGKDPSKV